MRSLAFCLIVALVALVGPTARPDDPPERQGCSLRDWRVVVETDRARLCLLGRS